MRPTEDVEYVVQVREVAVVLREPLQSVKDGDANAEGVWVDVATVKMPPKTKRRTALRQGLKDAGIEVTPDLEARALDRDAAYVWTGKPPSPPSLTLG